MSWMRSGTLLGPFLRGFLPNFSYLLLTGGVFLLRVFSVAFSVSPHVWFMLDLILICMFLR